MQAIGGALNGIQLATQQLNASHQQLNKEISAEAIVDGKVAEQGIKANLAAAKTIIETEEYALDILA